MGLSEESETESQATTTEKETVGKDLGGCLFEIAQGNTDCAVHEQIYVSESWQVEEDLGPSNL